MWSTRLRFGVPSSSLLCVCGNLYVWSLYLESVCGVSYVQSLYVETVGGLHYLSGHCAGEVRVGLSMNLSKVWFFL